ncbi:hypothetical protein JMJ35_003701 [Cladonia borealis]|uniref:Rhodopsin domain-containing protein n=1 Tax=Cladonia borealis TaxID=184061 RepID=A0AA39R5F1_9LECA|nr:hypothetical protein JMJ35_003701 [Cladonia borealis]
MISMTMSSQLPAGSSVPSYGGRGPTILTIAWTEAAVALVLMLLRTYTNMFIVNSFRWDYFWALITLVFGIIDTAMITVAVSSGLGNHMSLLHHSQIVNSQMWSWIAQSILIQAVGFGKYAVIAFLLRIQGRAQGKKMTSLTYLLYFIGISNFAINIIIVAMIFTSCSPTAKFWNQSLSGTCNNVTRADQMGYFQGSFAALSDLLLAGYPILVFWKLKISKHLKIGLCCLMGGGVVAAAAGIAKTVYIKQKSVVGDDQISPLIIWAWTEQWLILILGCLPPLRPWFAQAVHRMSTYKLPSRNHNSGYYLQNDVPNIPMQVLASNRAPKDTDSEEKILPGGAGILHTTKIEVLSKPRYFGEHNNEQ